MGYDIGKLTLEEKIMFLTGVNEWKTSSANGKIPQIHLSDGPNGLQMFGDDGVRQSATAMPALSLVASSWDKTLAYLTSWSSVTAESSLGLQPTDISNAATGNAASTFQAP